MNIEDCVLLIGSVLMIAPWLVIMAITLIQGPTGRASLIAPPHIKRH